MTNALNPSPAAVNQRVTLELVDMVGTASLVDSELCYDPCDPYAMTIAFGAPGSSVRWTFGRDLLVEGMYEPTGEGDVHVWPCLDPRGTSVVGIRLSSPSGQVLVQVTRKDADAFLRAMLALVPLGTESAHVDLDVAVATVLATPEPS